MSHKLGLTGSIGMGKSTTAQMFRDEGVPVWDADETVHQLYSKGGAAVAAIGKEYPNAIKDGAISRAALRIVIKEDLGALAKIESIVHPLVARSREAFITQHTDPLIVFDIPLLFETKANDWLDSVLVVTAPEVVQKERVLSRSDMDEDTFEFILSRQMPDSEKQAKADYLIETKTLDDTRRAIVDLIKHLSTAHA